MSRARGTCPISTTDGVRDRDRVGAVQNIKILIVKIKISLDELVYLDLRSAVTRSKFKV